MVEAVADLFVAVELAVDVWVELDAEVEVC